MKKRSRARRTTQETESPSDRMPNDTPSPLDPIDERVRNRRDERLGLDALDDRDDLPGPPNDLPLDAVDEIAAEMRPEDYPTDDGDRRPARDEAEMGMGTEAHSPEEIADRMLGRNLPGRRGTVRDGEVHGPDVGLR